MSAAVAAVLVSIALRWFVPLYWAPIVGGVIGAIIGLAVARLVVPAELLPAFEAFSWLGRSEMDRFKARTGSKVPLQRRDQDRWLDAHPPTAASRLSRIEVLAFIGRLDEAAAELEDVVVTDPLVASERASLVQYVGWLSDGDARLAALRATLAGLPLEEPARREADVTVAIADARARFMRGDADWSRPLQSVRPSLGRAASRVVWRDTWGQLVALYLVIGLIVGGAATVLLPLP